MALTPLLLIANDRLIQPRYDYRPQNVTDEVPPEPVANPVLIAGFGRFGQIVGRLLHGHGIGTTILEQDPSQIEMLRKFGYQVFYGDASRLDLLHAAGAHQARLLVLAVNDPATAVSIIETVRKHFPHLKILARAQDRPHAHKILRHGVDRVFRETLGSAVDLGVEALTQLGFRANQAWRAGQTFKRHDNRLLHEQKAHALALDIPFHLVDLQFGVCHLLGNCPVVLQQTLNGSGNCILAKCAHLNHVGIEGFQLCGVVLSHYPNLPEI